MAPHRTAEPSASAVRPAPKHWLMGDEFFNHYMPHHNSIKALWETKWRFPCSKSLYPFHDGEYGDFDHIFKDLIARSIDDGTSTAYTEAFFSTAEALEQAGDEAASAELIDMASRLYLRACCILRIARFPYITSFPKVNCAVKWKAWEMQKRVYLKASRFWHHPVTEVEIPHVHADGLDRKVLPAYVRVPKDQTNCPVVLLLTGLDGYRPDNTGRCDAFLERGWASVVVEIPGTADCPADPADPTSPDRLWDSLFEWMGQDNRFDMKRVMCWGLSAGGYYAVRIAHTHRHRLVASVAQGAGTHHFFDPVWLEKAEGHEYPFSLLPALAMKHGFQNVEDYLQHGLKRFSLLENGILEKPSTRLLLVNGVLDGLMPIEDSMLLFEYGSPKDGRFFQDAVHMGYPLANASIYPWMESVLNSVKP
ncbi:Alpha/Beta hydrolase protein [Xylaria sp. CBS 124048]|nr:Alpha/Beta hydrolase protein [Xylaria sp. CBS 124048]